VRRQHLGDGLSVTRGFLVRFSLAAGALLAVYYFPYGGALALLRSAYLVAYAHVAGAAISPFDSSVHVYGTRIVGRTSVEFAMNCDAMDVTLLFAAAVYAFPTSWRRRAAGLGCAFAGVLLLNVTRVVVLYLVRVHAPAWFELLHLTLFPLAIVAASAAGFLAWAQRASRVPAQA
jgi:exosortase/archaeosortase family protein